MCHLVNKCQSGTDVACQSSPQKVNQTGCPPGFATDEVFFSLGIPGSCDVDIGGFIAAAVIILAAKLYIAVRHSRQWVDRERNTKRRALQPQRKPIVPTISWLSFIVYFLFWVGGAADAFNIWNGLTPFFFGLSYTTYCISSLLYLSKFVSLGHRIARPTSKSLFSSTPGLEKLAKFDKMGKICLLLCAMGLSGQLVLMCIVQMILPVDRDLIIRASMATGMLFDIALLIPIVHQIQRVKKAIWSSIEANKNFAGGDAVHDLELVARKLTGQQLLFAVPNPISGGFRIAVMVGAVPLRWFVPLVWMILDTKFTLAIVLFDKLLRRSKQSTNNTPDAQNDEPLQVANENPILALELRSISSKHSDSAEKRERPSRMSMSGATVHAAGEPHGNMAQ